MYFPPSPQDLDDALHCTELSPGKSTGAEIATLLSHPGYRPGVYEVGVHIADVGYFVEAGTALDREAADRATSVYLVQRVS